MSKILALLWAAVFSLVALAFSLGSNPAHADVASEAPDWCAYAKKNLQMPSGTEFNCAARTPRCIKMNNYSCTKNFSNTAYDGELTSDKGEPITDVDHHVIYKEPKWSLKKSIGILHRYYTQLGKHSGISIAETWAPWCDTNGSKLVHDGWGRTCHDGPGSVNASFKGPRCQKPANNKPLKGQCGPCNCPNELASFYVKETGKSVSDDLSLFDAQGKPTSNLKSVLKRVIRMELGYWPTETLLQSALEAYTP